MRKALLALASAALLSSIALAAPLFSEAAAQLDGVWRGDDFVLKVDAHRAQASIDPRRPFAWEKFLVKEATDEEIVFTVGSELYEARIEDGKLMLTGTSFRGERVLLRSSATAASETPAPPAEGAN